VRRLIELDIPRDTFLNVNFPACDANAVSGTVVASQGRRNHGLGMEKRSDGRGFPYYWLRFARDSAEEAGEGTDLMALAHRQIAVTPLKLDMTDYAFQARLTAALGRPVR
jgi:5'-nucleotidase